MKISFIYLHDYAPIAEFVYGEPYGSPGGPTSNFWISANIFMRYIHKLIYTENKSICMFLVNLKFLGDMKKINEEDRETKTN